MENRTELIKRIKAEIAAGTYETPEKIEQAAERILDVILAEVEDEGHD